MDTFEAALQGQEKLEKKKPGKLRSLLQHKHGAIKVLGAFKSMAEKVDTSVGGRNGCYDAHMPYMFACYDGRNVVGLDLEMRAKTANFGGRESGILFVTAHAGTIVTGNKDGRVCAHDRDTMRLRWMRSHDERITAVEIYHGLVVTASQDKSISCWRLDDGYLLWTGSHINAVNCIHICSSVVLCGATDGNIHAFDLTEGFLWFSCNFPKMWMVASRQTSKFDPFNISITCIHSFGGQGFVGCKNGKVYSFKIPHEFVRDMRSPPILWTCTGYSTPVTCMTSDHKFCYTGSAFGDVSAWELEWGQRKWTASKHRGAVQVLALGKSRQLVSGGSDGQVHCWSIVKGDHKWQGGMLKDLLKETEMAQEGASHAKAISGVAVVQQLGLAVSVSEKDGSVRAWHLDTGEHLWTYSSASKSKKSRRESNEAKSAKTTTAVAEPVVGADEKKATATTVAVRKSKNEVTTRNPLALGMADNNKLFRNHTGGIVSVVGNPRLALRRGRRPNPWGSSKGPTHAWGQAAGSPIALPAAAAGRKAHSRSPNVLRLLDQ
jgi:WD40 repeat protein